MRRLYPKLLATVALLAAFVAVPATTAQAESSRDRSLQAALDAIVAAGMPGAFAEVRDKKHSWSGAAGLADVDTGRPMRPGFQQRVGSITKTFVATALLQLVGEGRLDLDRPIGGYLPDVVPGEVGASVTVRMLLNHSSGIGDYMHALVKAPQDLERYQTTTVAPRELVRVGLAAPRTGAPGEAYSYSNTNYILAGLLLEKITGRPAGQEIQRRIIQRLGLKQTYFPSTTTRIPGPHAAAYIPWPPDGGLHDLSEFNMSIAWMAGELVSSTHDLDVFFRALLTGGLLRPAELALMRTTIPYDPAHPEDGGYGLGLFSVPLPCGGYAWGHDGVAFGQSTLSLSTPDGSRQVTIAVNMTNYAAGGQPDPIGMAMEDFRRLALCGPSAA